MIAVGPLALDVKGQVDLRPRCLTNGTGTTLSCAEPREVLAEGEVIVNLGCAQT